MTLRDWWTVRDPLRLLRVQTAYWRPRFHTYEPLSGWSFTFGPLGICWETRYYRTTGLQVFIENHLWTVWPMTPSPAQNRALDARNFAAMKALSDERKTDV